MKLSRLKHQPAQHRSISSAQNVKQENYLMRLEAEEACNTCTHKTNQDDRKIAAPLIVCALNFGFLIQLSVAHGTPNKMLHKHTGLGLHTNGNHQHEILLEYSICTPFAAVTNSLTSRN
jgi:hypothetical protein